MLLAQDCRRKASEQLQAAEETSDPNTSQSLRRLSDQWTRLAEQIEQDASRPRHSPPPVRRPADLVRPREFGDIDAVLVADVLRARLKLSGSSVDEPIDSDTSR